MNPDFDTLIKNYDVLLFTETKTDNFDVLKIPCDYDVHFKTEKSSKINLVVLLLFTKNISQIIQNLFTGSKFLCMLK